MPICPSCGNKTADNAIFCDQCGTRLPVAEPAQEQVTAVQTPAGEVPEGVLVCPDCGAENVPGEVFCDTCGSPLEAPQPVVAAVVAEAEPVAEVAAEEMTYCPTCGAKVQPGESFCGNCGAALAAVGAKEELEEVEPILEEAEVGVTEVWEAPVEEVAVAEEPIEEEPIEEVLIEEVVVEEEPIEEVTLEEVVVEEEPIEEVMIEEVVVEEEPVAEVVLEEELIAEAAVEEVAGEEVAMEEGARCSVCGANVIAGQVYCASCGAAVQPAVGVAPELVAAPEVTAVVGPYLEVVESGAHIPLTDQPELLIGREDEVSGIHPDVDMTPHRGEEGGVSRRHARLIHEADSWFIVDLDSTNGTYLNGTELKPKVRTLVQDGDCLGLGDVEIVFHTG